MIIADTGALVALIDRDDRNHSVLRDLYEADPDRWLLPWAVLPEVDYLLATHVGARAQQAFLSDLSEGLFRVEWGHESDLARSRELHVRYPKLRLGLVDGVVMAVAERTKAEAIATLDVKHFGAVAIRGAPRVLPRDLD